MPVETVANLKGTYEKYLDKADLTGSDGDDMDAFEAALNEVMPRLYHMGFWRDMLAVLDGTDGAGEDVSAGYFDLPEDSPSTGVGYDSVISAMLDDQPKSIWSLWHDFRRFGQPSSSASASTTTLMGGFIDSGYTGVDGRRRYRVGAVSASSQATFLVKRKWVHVTLSSHKAYIPNDNSVIKHALLGKLAEDNADIERAEYHWAIAQKLLDADLDAYRGSAKPVLQVSPNGAGGAIRGMY